MHNNIVNFGVTVYANHSATALAGVVTGTMDKNATDPTAQWILSGFVVIGSQSEPFAVILYVSFEIPIRFFESNEKKKQKRGGGRLDRANYLCSNAAMLDTTKTNCVYGGQPGTSHPTTTSASHSTTAPSASTTGASAPIASDGSKAYAYLCVVIFIASLIL